VEIPKSYSIDVDTLYRVYIAAKEFVAAEDRWVGLPSGDGGNFVSESERRYKCEQKLIGIVRAARAREVVLDVSVGEENHPKE
jgi:hypothetical protein